ncbi:hypothetical protein HPP92_000767 [Vanilla planifolia]|uniref:Uncharacterized protein n=1 Tax=Vanilla planifolia TaxID=51239 RepID=A0A835VGY0_VANPL|nr:hypothetical protein HPP92_000767 [Vanilla planifolia]
MPKKNGGSQKIADRSTVTPNKQRYDASKTQDPPRPTCKEDIFQQHFPMAAQAMQARIV